MLKEIGLVKEIREKTALIYVEQGKQCESCHAKGGCSLGAKGSFELEVPKVPGLKVGQYVEMEIPSGNILKLSFLVYFLPVLAFIAVATATYYLIPEQIDRGLIPLLAGVVAMVLVFLPLKRIDAREKATHKYSPRILRVYSDVEKE